MADILGFDPLSPTWRSAADDRSEQALDELIRGLLDQRSRARDERDYATADAVRERLTAAGLAIEDGPDGSSWSWARG